MFEAEQEGLICEFEGVWVDDPARKGAGLSLAEQEDKKGIRFARAIAMHR